MSNVVISGTTSEDLAYYNKIRDTIQGLDGIIVKVITDSVTMITGALTLSVVLYDKLGAPLSKSIAGFILVVIAALITYNARQRIKLYSGLLGKSVAIAKAIEPKILAPDESLTLHLDQVDRAGLKGEKLYLQSTEFLFFVEAALACVYGWGLMDFLINRIKMMVTPC